MNSKDILLQAAKNNNLTHAYLAPARSGTNLRSYAAELGQIILCSPDDKDCRGKVVRETHPDFTQVKVLNDNSKISINQVEEIISSSSYSPVEGQRKLYVISRAEDLSLEGANSLLKILEDPPEFVYFLLLTESPNSLLPTIISRCQQLPRGGTSVEGMKDMLQSKGFDEEEVTYLIKVVNGKAAMLDELLEEEIENPLEERGKAREDFGESSLLEKCRGFVDSDSYVERDVLTELIFEGIEEANNFQLISGAEELVSLTRQDLEWFLEKGLIIYRNQYRKRLAEGSYPPAKDNRKIEKLRAVDRALETMSANVNVQLLLESLWLRLAGNAGIHGN
ncbi:MAG: hypothetical protein ABEJ25_02355 [Candidatus Bipolaricaulia bacterium]